MANLIIQGSSFALGHNIKSPFSAAGGTPPYVLSVLPDGVGGTIDGSGFYTAPAKTDPNETQFDTLQVEDSAGFKSQKDIFVTRSLGLVAEIVQREMELQNGQIYFWNQKRNIPPNVDMTIAVRVPSAKPFGIKSTVDGNGNEVQSMNVRAALQFDMQSKSMEAFERKEEVLFALKSVYSRRQQGLNSFKVFSIPFGEIVDLSEVDGAAIPYRYTITVYVHFIILKSKPTSFYDTFPGFVIEEVNP